MKDIRTDRRLSYARLARMGCPRRDSHHAAGGITLAYGQGRLV